jgi:hypothetical protein
MTAHILWAAYPGEIASDLSRYHHRRIADWHTGTICSHELLELLEHMDEDGAFKTALRQGEPSDQRRAMLQAANELAVLRASQVPGVDSEQYGSQIFFTAAKLREILAEEAEAREGREFIMAIGSEDYLDDDEE